MTDRSRSPRPGGTPSQRDVARLAGVSRTTVSLVVNGVAGAGISPETRDRVWAAVEELGFRPNAMARGLRSTRSNVLGLITSDIATTPFAVAIIKGAQDAALAAGKTLLIVDVEGDEGAAERAVSAMSGWRAEGIVYAAEYHRAVDPPPNLGALPCVLADCYARDRSLPSVVPDEVQGAALATQTLVKQGHSRIGFINGPTGYPASQGRLRGYQQALAAAGIAFDPHLVRGGDWWQESAYAATRALLARADPPTALFCANDWMAMGAYDALRELGVAIPGEVAVIGFDNREEVAAHMRPPLTTVALPYYEMGQWGIRYLLERAAVDGQAAPQVALECPLVERQSV